MLLNMASSEGSCFTCKEDLYKAQPCFKCPACYKCFHLACTTMETYTTKLDENLRNVGDQKKISPEQLDIAVGDMKSAFKAMSTQCPSEELSGPTNDDVVVIDGSKNTANDVDSEKLLNDNDNKIMDDSETISELNQGTGEATTYTSKKDSVSGNQMDLNGIIEDPKDGNAIIIEMDPKKIRDLIEGMEGNTIEYTQQVTTAFLQKCVYKPRFVITLNKIWEYDFQTAFIKRLQLEYEIGIRPSSDVVEEKLKTLREKITACTDDNERLKLQVGLEDQEYKFRRYCLGILRLMGEMCGIRMLTRERLMICIEELLEYKSDEKLEYMCVLLTTAGHLMGQYSGRMDIIFKKIDDIISKSRFGEDMENGKKISSRIRYTLQDVIDLRNRDWDQDRSDVDLMYCTPIYSSKSIGRLGSKPSQEKRTFRY